MWEVVSTLLSPLATAPFSVHQPGVTEPTLTGEG